ncbi:3-[(3aS,4S,7aS)-7a-methyl-1,5-dioxo-octahydro-1H-inden-4-yl]propanoyl:CoA ligase-like isoform X1 [Watersipora subatra]|uniref:3-[(3aS,4S,7aS)-7a-methyl-1, 5-dioxo-octahydro-1H-inden-4-yl]propanoyl:CoA ligase-like isoform X1 n=1 Tax=Watersipora subatra TaxID=2589382 RepID=UPI00355BE4EE
MQSPLTKSYTKSPAMPGNRYDLFHQAFANTRAKQQQVMLINMDTGERVSNLDILAQAEEYAKGLLSLDLIPGVDSIALIGCSTFQALALFAAAAEIGLGFAHLFIHPPREERITTQIKLLAPKVIVCGEGAGGHNASALFSLLDSETTGKVSSRLPSLEHIFYDSSYKDRSPTHKAVKTLYKLKELGETVSDDQLTEARERVQPDFICQHLFTSGSTGNPKCASRTQHSFANFMTGPGLTMTTIVSNMNVDTLVSYTCLVRALVQSAGAIVMIPETYEEMPLKEPGKLLTETIIAEKVEVIALTISVIAAIMEYMKEQEMVQPHQIKIATLGGQLISYQFIEEFQQIIKAAVLIGYGMTEMIGIGMILPGQSEDAKLRLKTARLSPQPDTEVRIADAQDQVVDIGEVGEIQAKNFSVFKEYKDDEEQTKQMFTDDGFIRTGDAGKMFPDGTFKVLGRMNDKDRFNIYGKVEYPGPIEEIFCLHPEIRQACVVTGKQNDWIGDEITCCIQTKEKPRRIPEESLLQFCKSNGMYQRQQPARILYFDEFPATDNKRKTSKRKLRELVKQMLAEDDRLGKCQWFIELENSGRTY